MKACPARHTHYKLCHNLTTNTNLIYSPDGESLAGEAGISTGSEGVAIHEKDAQRSHTSKYQGRIQDFLKGEG